MPAVTVIRRFRSLLDVNFGTPADGDAVVYDAGTDELVLSPVAGTPGPPGANGATGPADRQEPTVPPDPLARTVQRDRRARPAKSAGKMYYLAPSDPSDIATYMTLLSSPSAGAEQTIATPCSGTADTLIGVFVTNPGEPGALDFPAGTAFRRIYANVNRGTAKLHYMGYVRNGAGVETLVRDEYSDTFANVTVAVQEWIVSASAAGALLATDRLVTKLYAQRVAGTAPVTVTTYYEGTSHVSHVQTTISAGAQGPPGADPVAMILATWQGDVPSAAGVGPVWRVPYVDGVSKTFDVTRVYARVETAGSGSTTVLIQKSPAGAFVATTVTTLTIGAAAYEDEETASLGTVASGQLLRVNWTIVGATGPSTVELEGTEA